MRELPMRKKILLAMFAVTALVSPLVFGAAAQGGDAIVPLVRIAPDYPPEALAARREGDVHLEFTVDLNGTTKDIVVVDSSSPEFEEFAVAALMRWRYAPLLQNGVAVENRGVRTVIRFQLADVEPRAEAE